MYTLNCNARKANSQIVVDRSIIYLKEINDIYNYNVLLQIYRMCEPIKCKENDVECLKGTKLFHLQMKLRVLVLKQAIQKSDYNEAYILVVPTVRELTEGRNRYLHQIRVTRSESAQYDTLGIAFQNINGTSIGWVSINIT